MRKILLTALLAAGGLTASAQYLPNGDFEQWKTTCGKSDQTSINKYLDTAPFGLATRPGVEPQDWNGSNVNQTVFGYNASSDALVTRQKEGDNSYVRLVCTKVGAKIGQGLGAIEIKAEAPAFINFGTPWVYAVRSKINVMAACMAVCRSAISLMPLRDATSVRRLQRKKKPASLPICGRVLSSLPFLQGNQQECRTMSTVQSWGVSVVSLAMANWWLLATMDLRQLRTTIGKKSSCPSTISGQTLSPPI